MPGISKGMEYRMNRAEYRRATSSQRKQLDKLDVEYERKKKKYKKKKRPEGLSSGMREELYYKAYGRH